MRKEGERLIIEPAAAQSLLTLLKTLKPIDEDFAPIPDTAPEPVDLWPRVSCSTPTSCLILCATHRGAWRRRRRRHKYHRRR